MANPNKVFLAHELVWHKYWPMMFHTEMHARDGCHLTTLWSWGVLEWHHLKQKKRTGLFPSNFINVYGIQRDSQNNLCYSNKSPQGGMKTKSSLLAVGTTAGTIYLVTENMLDKDQERSPTLPVAVSTDDTWRAQSRKQRVAEKTAVAAA